MDDTMRFKTALSALPRLAQVEDRELAGLAKTRLGDDIAVSTGDLAVARDIARELGRAMARNDAAAWTRVRAARDVILGVVQSPKLAAPPAAPMGGPPPADAPSARPLPSHMLPQAARPLATAPSAPPSWASPPPPAARFAIQDEGTVGTHGPESGAALPFRPMSTGTAAHVVAPLPENAAPAVRVPTGTVAASSDPLTEPVLPFAPPGGVTLERYAALRAEVALFPAKKVEIFSRFGLADEADYARVVEAYKASMNDGGVGARFMTLYARHTAELKKTPR